MLFCIKSRNASSRLYKENRKLLTLFNAPKTFRPLLPFKETSQRIIPLQNPWNIWPPVHIAPFPKRKKKGGPILFSPRTSILLLGVWVQLHGLSVWWDEYVCQGNNIQQDCAQGPGGDLKFTVTGLDSCGNVSHVRGTAAFRYTSATELSHEKGRCMEIRCPHGCKAWIYCKQIMILAPRSASLDWEITGH